jgi:hypothetical protein
MKDVMTLSIMNKRNFGKTLRLAGTLALLTTPLVSVGRARMRGAASRSKTIAMPCPKLQADFGTTIRWGRDRSAAPSAF